MAITRTQIAKQLLAQGGRTGFQGGGADMGTVSTSTRAARDEGAIRERMQSIGATPTPKEDKGPPVEYIDGTPVPVTVDNRAEREKLRKEQRARTENRLKEFRRLDSKQRKFQEYLSKFSPVAMFASKFGPLNTRDFFIENVLQSRNPLYSGISKKDFSEMTEEEREDLFQDYLKGRLSGETDAYGNQLNLDRDGPSPLILPDTTSEPISSTEEEIAEYVNPVSFLSPRIAGSRFLGTEFAADGGIIRDEYLLGGIVKGIKKGIKKATRGIKKIAKSPLGKAALLAAPFAFSPAARGAIGSFFGTGSFNPFLRKVAGDTAFSGLGSILNKAGLVNLSGTPTILGGLTFASLPFLLGGKEPKDEFDLEAYYAANRLNPNAQLFPRIVGTQMAADGGRIGYQEGSKEPVAKKTMPLLDMGGMEKDYREDGGFVPIGRMEKADDVPARLSKNEFVFTADAVRNAGDGDVDKGAEVMYNMMKNLEAGGDVSEESQGLKGARKMFQTSQRLEEVL